MSEASNTPMMQSGHSESAGFHIQRVNVTPQVSLEVEIGGPEDAPAIIFLHGGGQTRYAWKAAGAQVAEAGYRVLLYDARGHGGSDWSPDGDYSFDALANDLLCLIASQRRPVALVGASMGGMTSFLVAGREPQKVAALILVDIVPSVNPDGATRVRRFMTAHGNGFDSLEEAADAVAAYNPGRPRPENPSGLMRYLRPRNDGRLYWHWDPRLLSPSTRAEPPSFASEARAVSAAITAPTLLVRGMKSDMIDDAGVSELKDLVPQTEVFEVEGAGHMVAGDRNDAFSDAIVEFLHRHFPMNERAAG
tara:strand:+ start:6397 stop:7314 length:918 start_codon:yes stop_codon:yes gene_type:complete